MSINKWLSSHWHSFQDNSNSVSYCRPGVSEASPAGPQSSLVFCLLRRKTAYQASETPDEGLVCLLGQKSQLDCGTTQSGPSFSLVTFTNPQKSFRSLQMPTSKESSGPHIQDQHIRKHSSALQICSWRRNLSSLSVCRWKVHSPCALGAWKNRTTLEKFFKNDGRHGSGFGPLELRVQRPELLTLLPLHLTDAFQFVFMINETLLSDHWKVRFSNFLFSVKATQ